VGVRVFFAFHEAHVKSLGHENRGDLHISLGKGLAKADALAPKEWTESKSVSLLALGCQRKGAAAVKSLGSKLFGPLPLVSVLV